MAASDNINRNQIPNHHINAIRDMISQIETVHDTRIEPSPQGMGGATLNIGGRRIPSGSTPEMFIHMDGNRLMTSRLSQTHMVEKEGVVDPGGLGFYGGASYKEPHVSAFGPVRRGREFSTPLDLPAGSTARDHAEASLSALREALHSDDLEVDGEQSPRKPPRSGVSVRVSNSTAVGPPVSRYHYDPATGNISHWKDS